MPTPPPDQTNRNIGFLLEGGGLPSISYDFYIRPEDLVYPEPSRLAVFQTLGGAWADNFGRGLGTLSLSGNCGWRGTANLSGEDLFKNLRTAVFQGWHDRRKSAITLGQDPTQVNLYYADSLDNISLLIAPQTFTLRRSRTSPLLMHFEIQLLSLGDASLPADAADAIATGMTNPLRWQDAIIGINLSNTILGRFVSTVSGIFSTISGYVTKFINAATSVFATITSYAQQAQGIFDETVGTAFALAQNIARAGSIVFGFLASTAGLIASDIATVMQVASAFTDIYCSMVNGFNTLKQYLDFSGLLGASNCSSTGGGEPPSFYAVNNLNPFDTLYVTADSPVSISSSGQSALDSLSVDPLSNSSSVATVGSQMGAASSNIIAPAGSPLAAQLNANTGAFSGGGYNFGADQ